MPKMDLPRAFADGNKIYGPGEAEVPAEAAKKIKKRLDELKDSGPMNSGETPSQVAEGPASEDDELHEDK
jgi:hypothetical protein